MLPLLCTIVQDHENVYTETGLGKATLIIKGKNNNCSRTFKMSSQNNENSYCGL